MMKTMSVLVSAFFSSPNGDREVDERPFLGAIAAMESQIETMRNSISALKSSGTSKPSKKEKKREKLSKSASASAPIASSSKPSKKENKAAPKKKAGGGGGKKNAAAAASQPVAEDDTLTFEQKKDLSDAITRIDGQKLERVIQIIHEGVPEIRDVSLYLSLYLFASSYPFVRSLEPRRD